MQGRAREEADDLRRRWLRWQRCPLPAQGVELSTRPPVVQLAAGGKAYEKAVGEQKESQRLYAQKQKEADLAQERAKAGWQELLKFRGANRGGSGGGGGVPPEEEPDDAVPPAETKKPTPCKETTVPTISLPTCSARCRIRRTRDSSRSAFSARCSSSEVSQARGSSSCRQDLSAGPDVPSIRY